MKLSEIDYMFLLESLHDGVYFVDTDRTILFWNQAAQRISGFAPDEVLGRCCAGSILMHMDGWGTALCREKCPLERTINDGEPREAEMYLHHRQGHLLPVLVKVYPVKDPSGAIVGAVEVFSDISERSATQVRIHELEKLTMLDRLTTLANKRYVEIELYNRLNEMERYGIGFGLVYLDIDNLREINAAYGREAGDTILKVIAKTLLNNSRPFDLYGRWGGEEFVCILKNVSGDELYSIGNRLRILVEQSYFLVGRTKVRATVSCGATLARPSDTVNGLLGRAVDLMQASKGRGRNHITVSTDLETMILPAPSAPGE